MGEELCKIFARAPQVEIMDNPEHKHEEWFDIRVFTKGDNRTVMISIKTLPNSQGQEG